MGGERKGSSVEMVIHPVKIFPNGGRDHHSICCCSEVSAVESLNL